MGQYLRGDVLLAPVALDSRSQAKTRPVIVIATSADGELHVCPVSSKPPTDAPSLPLSIDDFETGGLDLFGESYIMTSRVVTLRSGQVIGKRGRLTSGSLSEVIGRVPDSCLSGSGLQKPGKRPAAKKGR
ncbi:MAG: type II toxin-antitoxin system PemK/MazF family toxin [Methanomicrobiales archaeon]|nr:type II toxin-antitoxin system PemK/MazF family toxin [Methanomicrobiales archaeon]